MITATRSSLQAKKANVMGPGQHDAISIDDAISANLVRAFENCFGEFQSGNQAIAPGHEKHVEQYLPEGETVDLDSLWNDLIGNVDRDQRDRIDVQVAALVAEERFMDAVKIGQGDELDTWPTSYRLLWKDLVELVPEQHRMWFLKQFPEPPARVAERDLLAAARIQAAAHDQLRQMIGLLPHDIATRQIYWTEMINHVRAELARAFGVFESVMAFCSRSCQKQQSPYWTQATTLHRAQMYSQGLREMIRVLHRLQMSLPTVKAMKPSSPVFLLLSAALNTATELIRWIHSKRDGTDSIVKAIGRNLTFDEGCIKASNTGTLCQICFLTCDAYSDGHISTSWIVHDQVMMHSSCANLFSRSTNREPSCLRMISFLEQLGQ